MAKIKSIAGYRETEYEIYLSRRKQEDFQKTLLNGLEKNNAD